MRCLLIEDYTPLRKNIVERFQEEGYAVDASGTGDGGLDLARRDAYDVIVLDLMLPGLDGLSVLRGLRALQDTTPVLIISARDAIGQRVEGLDAGADDYLVKPFVLAELVARVRALARRTAEREQRHLLIADLAIDLAAKRVVRDGYEVALTHREYRLLEYLARHRGQPVSRKELWEHVQEAHEAVASNAIDVRISQLRKKLNANGRPNLIHTNRGFGFTLSAE